MPGPGWAERTTRFEVRDERDTLGQSVCGVTQDGRRIGLSRQSPRGLEANDRRLGRSPRLSRIRHGVEASEREAGRAEQQLGIDGLRRPHSGA